MKEREMLVELKEKRKRRDETKEAFELASKEYEQAQTRLIQALEDAGKTSTAKYEGIGFATMPESKRIYANYTLQHEEDVFKFLTDAGYREIIKKTVNTNTLSSVIGEMIKEGKEVPGFITYYVKPSIRFYESN